MSSISLKLGYKYLRSNKGGVFSFTTLLAIIGLSIGISSLIVVTSVMNGFEKELEDRILGVIPHSVISSDEPIDDYENLINQVKKDANILEASTYINTQGIISSSYDTRGISLIGIDPLKEKNMSIIPDYMLVGDLNDLNEDNTIIIGSLLAAQIGAYIGDEVNITTSDIRTSLIGSYPRSVNLEVVGIFELKTEIDQYLTLISHSTSQKIKNLKANQTTGIRLKTNNLFNADIITENIINNLDSNNLSYSSWKNTHGTLFEAIKFEKLLISLMLFLIIAVASILVLSTVVMTVKSKEREIGILLTLGASNKQIVLIFFTQGLIVTIIGIFVGILLGFLLIYNLNNLISVIESMLDRNLLEAYFINYFPYYINFGQIFLICFFSFLISLISSLIPSLRAVRLNPVEILRHE
ncbi:MAG: lipoprotein-releasing ABC transporter permease subunit [SAR86 cluster bacterium]|uniref:Lipoprotein-releasing ABC transporter permease subunit n=1 Tax=SAR86 cluster bacterium TaxID=2030880 RepID=A0A520N2X9_9GAMM|nr:MAG: lipoprotein-releasing ABC transporter permease subunit [SAR86 cluster bacterium]